MKDIENDLYQSFNKIHAFWEASRDTGTLGSIAYDSLEVVNQLFLKKLQTYTSEYPGTLRYDFPHFKNTDLSIITSKDERFRIYSWDTKTGYKEHFFINVYQYQGEKTDAKIVKDTIDFDNPKGFYSEIFELAFNNRNIYIGYFHTMYSNILTYDGVRLFEIKNQELNDSLKLFKTEDGLQNKLGFEFDFFSVVDRKERPIKLIECSYDGKTIRIPVIDDKLQVTNKWITYKFDGKYFVKSKN